MITAVAALELALDPRCTPAGQQALAGVERLLGTRIDVQRAARLRAAPRSSACSPSPDPTWRRNQVTLQPSEMARSGCMTLPVVMTMLVPAPSAISPGLDLGLHAAFGQLRAGVAGHGLDLGR